MNLEDKVNDKGSKGFIKKALKIGWKLGMAATTTALSISTVGTLGVIVGAAFAGGGAVGNLIRRKSLYETISTALTTYSAVNAVMYPIVWLGDTTFPLIPNETFAGKALRAAYASTLYNAAFVGSFRGASHLVDNYLNPSGITKTISNNFYNEWKRIGTGFFPGYALAANGVTSLLGVPTFAWNAFPLGMYNSLYPIPTTKKSENPGYLPRLATAPQYA